MENATKALLIAASVLIVIVLIAVGIKILGSTQGVTNDVGKVSEATQMSIHNSQFTDYEGTQSGAEVKALLNKVAASQRTGSEHVVSVSGVTDIATYRAGININQTYSVVVSDTDGDGYVDTVSIS